MSEACHRFRDAPDCSAQFGLVQPRAPGHQNSPVVSCASCHGWDGNGQQVANAALRGARTVNDPAGTNLVRVIMEGTKVGSPVGDIAMPGFAGSLSDSEIAAISKYVLGHFGGKTGSVTAADVKSAR